MKFDKTVNYIKDMMEKNRMEMVNLPMRVNPQNFPECVEVVLKFLNSIIRSHIVVEICNLAEGLDIPGRDKAQVNYYKEVVKEHIVGLVNSLTRLMQSITSYYPESSFENMVMKELEKLIEQFSSKYTLSERKQGEAS